MDIEAIWLIILAISAPIGGVIGFFLQIRQLNQAKLENHRLELEIEQLKRSIHDAEQVIVRATPEEIQTYGKKISEKDVLFSRMVIDRPISLDGVKSSLFRRLWESLIPAFFASLALAFVCYLIYDLYRVGRWIFMIAI